MRTAKDGARRCMQLRHSSCGRRAELRFLVVIRSSERGGRSPASSTLSHHLKAANPTGFARPV